MDNSGKVLREIGKNNQLNAPFGVTVSLNDVITVADTGNGFLQQFDINGNFIRKIGWVTGVPDRYNYYSVAADSKGNVYVVDSLNDNIYEFAPDLSSLLSTYPGIPEIKFGIKGEIVIPARRFKNLRAITFNLNRDTKGRFYDTNAMVIEARNVIMFGVDSSPIAVVSSGEECSSFQRFEAATFSVPDALVS